MLENDTLGVVIADVSDKGAAAALFMAVARSFIRSYAHAGLPPTETLGQTNDLIVEDSEGGMFVTAYHSVFQHDGYCQNVNAGHNPPLLYRHATQSASMLPIGGRAIGWFKSNPLEAKALQLQPGDVLVYYTDGLTEAEDAERNDYGVNRLQQTVVSAAPGRSAAEIRDYILQDVAAFCGETPLFDDLTLVVVRYTGG